MKAVYSEEQSFSQVDLDGFDNLYQKYHQAVYANIWKMVQQREATEDILQEVFLALWEHRHKLDISKVAGWLFVVSFNKAARYLKKQQKVLTIQIEETAINSVAIQDNSLTEELHVFKLSMVEEAVNHLSARKKAVFTLCRYEGKSYDEVAGILGISVTSVKDYLHQSTRFIKDYIANHYTEVAVSVQSALLIYLC